MLDIQVNHVIDLSERTAHLLSKLISALNSQHHHHHKFHAEGVKIMFVVPDDQADVAFSITPASDVLDSEGNVISPAPHLNYALASSDDAVLTVVPGADEFSGTLHFGGPGIGSLTVTVTLDDGTVMATAAANFTVTTGNPASVQGVGIAIPGLTEQNP